MPVSGKQSEADQGAKGFFRVLTELAPDLVTLIDRDRIIKYVSPAV